MTQEEKQLLLKDLCARLPYKVKVKEYEGHTGTLVSISRNTVRYSSDENDNILSNLISYFKPYLRPMSSMTEEEKSWYKSLRNALTYQENGEYDFDDFNELNDFLNRKKLDRYGLIEKGLALEAPEGMYNI